MMTKPARDWERDWKLSESLADWGNWYSVDDIAKHVGKVNEAQAAMKYWLQRVKELEEEIEKRNKILHTIESLVKAIGKVIPEYIKSELQEGERK